MEQPTNIRQLIHRLMGNSNVSDFARTIGLPDATIRKILEGKRQPGVSVLRAIANTFPASACKDDIWRFIKTGE